MADYDCCDPRLTTSSSMEIAVSSSQALPNSTNESMWEGWTLASPPVSQCALTEQLQQHLGGGFSSSGASSKSGSSYQHDLLSSWLMSGYQSVGGLHQQQQAQHGGEECSGVTTMYQDEFSRMNICSSTSSDYHGSATSPSAAAGGGSTEATHQNLFDVMQTCSSSVQSGSSSGGPTVDVGEQSAQFLSTPPLDNDHHHIEPAAHKLDDHGKQKMVHQMNNHATVASTVAELRSRASSSSPQSGLNNSYAQTTLQQHLSGGQFDNSNYWASTGSIAATVTSSSPQPSICSVGGAGRRSSGHHREDQQPGCDSIILHHQHHQKQQYRSKKDCEGDEALFHNSGTDLTTDQMYNELNGLFGKSLDGAAADLHHQHVASNAAGSYGDHSNWTQFTVGPSLSVPSAHAGGFMGMQDVADRTMFESSTADSLSTAATHAAAAARREESSPSSAGTAMSTIHNFTAAAAANLAAQATFPYNRSSSSTDLESSDMTLQRKRALSQGSEQVGGNAEDSVKRSCIVRCLWEQNIAQLQLENLPSAHHRNLWQLQSQALFGRLPTNFLMGGSSSSNPGSMDMSTAVGPALNTNGRPRARRGSATDPQSVYARHRRERINDRLKVLQHLVPNGAKVDIVTMLEEAINYVKFLQLQVRLLSSDELWIYAPTTYNGMDVSMGMHAGLLDQQA